MAIPTIPTITVVAGCAGCGKTTWILQQLSRSFGKNLVYLSPGTGNVPIDLTHLAADFPELKVYGDGQEIEFIKQLGSVGDIFIELGSHLELEALAPILDGLTYRKVAIVPPQLQGSDYHGWAQQIVKGATIDTSIIPNKLWRVPTKGQVIDEESLNEFWYEVINGAYGAVVRAKGIFDVADGRSIYGDYVAGVPSGGFLELDLPRYLEGRPQRFSGVEVLGRDLDEPAMRQTLQDCCLSDALISQYQEQVKQILLDGEASV
jgi:hypothetical protein